MAVAGQSWGRYPRVEQRLVALADAHAPLPAVDGSLLPHGNGRSYGDSCLNPGGTVLHTRGLDHFIAFDPATGVLRCEAGMLLGEILDVVVPQGWFLPVMPGTGFVTVGGAIANDVHGKNHAVAGSFGHHVRAFELLRSDGGRRVCRPDDADGWFRATVGGLGLTGLVTWAELQLRRIPGPWMAGESVRFACLQEYFPLVSEASGGHEYTVAWIDCLARGGQLGRGLLHRADHAPALPGEAAPTRRLAMPFTPPVSLVNRASLRAFNTLLYRHQRGERAPRRQHYGEYFQPLDGVRDWNRMYGPRGFLQYQCVVPPRCAADAVAGLLRAISATGQGSFLAVLKPFGGHEPAGLLSFPRAGTTLALDFPNTGPDLFALLDRLDAITDEAGGAVYPAKDARWPGRRFRAAYPGWQAFLPYVDPRFSSGFWRRAME